MASVLISMLIRLRWRDVGQDRARFFLFRAGIGCVPGSGIGEAFRSRRRLKSPKAKVTQNTEVKSPKSTALRIVPISSSVG